MVRKKPFILKKNSLHLCMIQFHYNRGGRNLKQEFLDYSMFLIMKNKDNYSEEEKEKLLYGLEGLYLTLTKMVILLLFSFLLGFTKEFIICIILLNIIRFPAFGFHANKSIECLITSSLFIIGIPFLLLKLHPNIYIKLSLSIICLINFVLYAPADTVKRPLPNKRKRKIRKCFSVLCCFLYASLCFIFHTHYISNLFLSAMIIESILINPIIYKLFKQPYRNYLNYQ